MPDPDPMPTPVPDPEPSGPLFEPSDDRDPCLSLELVGPSQVPEGQGAELAVDVTNNCDEAVERGVFIEAAPAVVYLLKDGRVVWDSLSDDPPPPLVPGVINFEPGETRVLEEVWEGRGNNGEVVPEGTYQLVGRMEVAIVEDESLFLDSEELTFNVR